MENKQKKQELRKGFLSTIWESMTKTGGCCGSGENCCGPSQPDNNKKEAEKKDRDDNVRGC